MIKHQKQPSESSCGHTCIAMLAGIKAEHVLGRFKEPLSYGAELAALAHLGYSPRPVTVDGTSYLGKEGLYLLCVTSSLDYPAHSVLLDLQSTDNMYCTLYDPSKDEPEDGVFSGLIKNQKWSIISVYYLEKINRVLKRKMSQAIRDAED